MKAVAVSLMLVVGLSGVGCEGNEAPEGSAETSALTAKKLRYEQVDISTVPAPYDFTSVVGLSDKAEVYAQGFECDDEFIVCTLDVLKRGPNGQFEVIAEDFSMSDVTGKGDVGGCTVDNETGNGHAAVLRANGTLELIPRLSDEVSSCVIHLSAPRVAVIFSFDGVETTVYILDGKRITPFTLPDASVLDINDRGQAAGIDFASPEGNRGFRFDSRIATATILEPVPPDPDSWGQAINKHGEVLGYSFAFNAIERIGKWNRQNEFETFFTEGTPEFPTISNSLIWNEDELIVVSQTTDRNTYLIPTPGVRLNLADLVADGSVDTGLLAVQINKKGDFVGFSFDTGRSLLYLRK
jgi:hypothetical protein